MHVICHRHLQSPFTACLTCRWYNRPALGDLTGSTNDFHSLASDIKTPRLPCSARTRKYWRPITLASPSYWNPTKQYQDSMCQVCSIRTIATKQRWPKPLEHSIEEYVANHHKLRPFTESALADMPRINFVVDLIHDDYEKSRAQCAKKTTVPKALLEELRTLSEALEQLEVDRAAWWHSPEKKAARRRYEDGGHTQKLTDMQKVNNMTSDSIQGMQAKLGLFVKWSLGMDGGVWELVGSGEMI